MSTGELMPAGPIDKEAERVRLFRKLTIQQRIYLKELPEHKYRRWATIKAVGSSSATLWRWLRQPNFARAMELIEERAVQDLEITHHRVLQEYSRLAFSSIGNAYNKDTGHVIRPHEMDEETAAAVSEFSYDAQGNPRVKMHEKRGALDALSKVLRLAPEQVEVTGKNGGPIETKNLSDTEVARWLAFMLAKGLRANSETATSQPLALRSNSNSTGD